MLTNSNEMNVPVPPAAAKTPQNLIDHSQVFGPQTFDQPTQSIINPGDAACLASQQASSALDKLIMELILLVSQP